MIKYILLLITSFTVFSQSQWQVAIGGSGEDVGYSIIQVSDGGFIVAGTSISYGGWYIVKLRANGTLQWSKVLSGTDHAFSIIKTNDGGFAVCGEVAWDFCLVKFDSLGNIQWSRTVGGNYEDRPYGVVQTTDGAFIMGGWTFSFAARFHFYVVKLNAAGVMQWNKMIAGPGAEYAYSITATSDGGCALAGYTNSYGSNPTSILIVKLDSAGTMQWSKTISQGISYNDAQSIIQTSDGGYCIAGSTMTCGGYCGNIYIIKLNAGGNFQWTRTVGGPVICNPGCIIQNADRSFAVIGNTPSVGAGNKDLFLVKLDSNGVVQWSKTAGGSSIDLIHDIIQSADGGYAAVGYTLSFGSGNYDMYVVKLDSTGGTCGITTSPSVQSGVGGEMISSTPNVTSQTPTVGTLGTNITSAGTLTGICNVGIISISGNIPEGFSISQNYPNPFNPSTKIQFQIPKQSNIKINVCNSLGQETTTLVNRQFSAGTYSVDWDASNYASGIYYYTISAGDYTETKKMLLIK